MTDLPNRTASRLRAPSWRDSRLLVGVLLVLACTAGGAYVVRHADDRVPVLVAAGPLVPGDRLTSENTARIDVQLGDDLSRYLPASTDLTNRFAVAGVGDGELIPAASTGDGTQVAVQPVTLLVDATSALALVRGSVVDIYVNPPLDGTSQGFKGSSRALQGVAVAADPSRESSFGSSGSTVAVRVLVPTQAVVGLIDHIDNGSRITLVPVPGSPTRTGS